MGDNLDHEDPYEVTYKLTADSTMHRGHVIVGRATKEDAEALAELMSGWSWIEWARVVPFLRAHRRTQRPRRPTVDELATELGITEWRLLDLLGHLSTCAGLMFTSDGQRVAPWAAAGARATIQAVAEVTR